MARVAIYCRVSSDEQAEKGTIQAQIDYARRYLELHGPEMGIDGYEFYLDEGVSGTIALPNRPDGSRLISDAKQKKFQALLVYRLDRLARSVKHVLDTYDLLDENGIGLKSMTEAFDTSTPTGKFFMTLLASIAALERETILERTQGGKERNAKEGKWVSGAPPFGYRIQDKRLVIHEPEAETVRMIFRLYNEGESGEGMSTVEIARYLNANNRPTPSISKGTKNKSTGKWHAGHISIVLRTEAYSGNYTYLKRSKRKKETIELAVPPIISAKDFDKTQVRLIENANVARGRKGHNYLLRGKVFCAHCGRAMVGSSGDSKSGRVYYRCTGTVDTGQGKKCDAKQIRATALEDAVWQDIHELLSHPEGFADLMQKSLEENKENIGPIQTELNEVENAILEKQAARGRILRLVAQDKITEQEAESILGDLSSELSALNSRKEFLFGKLNSVQENEQGFIEARMVFDIVRDHLDELHEEEKSALIKVFVRRINVETVTLENGKRDSIAHPEYNFLRGMELSNSGETYNYTSLYCIESTWVFHAFSRKGGERISWR